VDARWRGELFVQVVDDAGREVAAFRLPEAAWASAS
jgi:hypothetical protein